MTYIDTTTNDFNDDLNDLIYDLRLNHENNLFNENEFTLVRSCNYLPDNGICHPINSIPFIVKTNTPTRDALYQIFRKINNINVYNEDENYHKFIEMVNKYSPYSTQYRSTVHFCLNGLVSDHEKGTWSNQNYIIIDPLKYHLNSNMESLRFEDTYIKGDVQLSNEALIIIDEEKYNELKNDDLDKYNLVIYKGDRKKVVDYVLAKMGIIPVNIKTHNMNTEDELYSLFSESLDNIQNKYNIGCDKHIYSESYKLDDEKNMVLWHMYYEDFYNSLFEYFNLKDNDLYDYLLNSTDIFGKSDKMEELIYQIGIENFCNFLNMYNNNLLQAKANGLLPSNNEILQQNKLKYKQDTQR